MDLCTFVHDNLQKYQEAHGGGEDDNDRSVDTTLLYPSDSDNEVECEGTFRGSWCMWARIKNLNEDREQYLHKFALHVHARNEELLDRALQCLLSGDLGVQGTSAARLIIAPVFFGIMFAQLLEGVPAAGPLRLEDDFLINDDNDDVPPWSWRSPLDPYYGKYGVEGVAARNDATRQRLQTPLAATAPSFVAARVPCCINFLRLFEGYMESELTWRLQSLPGMCGKLEDLEHMVAEGDVAVTVRANERRSASTVPAACSMPSLNLTYRICALPLGEDLSFTSLPVPGFTMLVVWLSRYQDTHDKPLPCIERVVVETGIGATLIDRSSADLLHYSNELVTAVIVPVSERAVFRRAHFFEDVFFSPCSTNAAVTALDPDCFIITVWFDSPAGCLLHCHSFL